MNLQPSSILDVLGPDLFAPFRAIRIPGKVIWCNFELARQAGFDVPESNQMNAELHDQLISAFSVRALRAKEDPGPQAPLILYADKYGGDGVAPCLGSARAGFFPYCNAFVKGIGFTPLFKHYDAKDFEHSHGGLNMDQAFSETVFGEVNLNLFDKESPRILVIIDQDDNTVYPKSDRFNPGKVFPRAITVRVGDQLRPAHLLAKSSWQNRSRLDVFQAVTRASGHIVMRKVARTKGTSGMEVADLRSTMLRIIDDQALIASQQIRWRMSHLNLSCSNMKMDGSLLDLTTQRSHPRLPSIRPDHSLLDSETAAYPDYADRTGRIVTVYCALRRSIPRNKHKLLNAGPLNIKKEMDRCYHRYLRRQLLYAAGLKTRVADCIVEKYPGVAERFTEVLMKMSQIQNPVKTLQKRGNILESAALDVFHLLTAYPEEYFKNPKLHVVGFVQEALRPIFKGSNERVARKRSAAAKLSREFCSVYQELMEAVQSCAMKHYGTLGEMQTSVKLRSAFENRVTDLLFRKTYCDDFDKAIAEYRATGDLDPVREAIDDRVSASQRNIDRILRQGGSQLLPDGALDLQIRVIDGVRCSVRVWNGSGQRRCLRVSAPVAQVLSGSSSSANPDRRCVDHGIAALRFRFTINDGPPRLSSKAPASEVPVCLSWDQHQNARVAWALIEVACMYGELQGYFYAEHKGKDKTRRGESKRREIRYVFAMPDRVELTELLKSARESEPAIAVIARDRP